MVMFKSFIEKRNQTKFLIVIIDECSFNPTTIPRYLWMKRGIQSEKLIRETTNRYNSITAQWDKFVYFFKKLKPQMKRVFEVLWIYWYNNLD